MKDTIIAVPTMGSVHTLLASWVKDQPCQAIFTHNVTPHSRARNLIADAFLDSEYTYLFFVDSDTLPPKGAITTLKKHITDDVLVATGITPVQNGDKRAWNVYQKTGDVEKQNDTLPTKPFPVVGAGMSCCLIHRDAFAKIEKPYFKSIEFENNKICSEDLWFCERVTQEGITIMCDPSVVCQHYKVLPL